MKKYSIVIPTYNHFEDCLLPNIKSIIQYTDLSNVEVIIVANGCTDGTKDYLETLPKEYFKTIWYDEPKGYTFSTNRGIEAAVGEYVILLNNDTVLLDQPVNKWLDILEKPFKEDPTVGITGPMQNFDPSSGRNFLVFFCVMIKRDVFLKVGLLDEIYNPGYGEDVEMSNRCEEEGIRCVQVPETNPLTMDLAQERLVGQFPIYHYGEATIGKMDDANELLVRNRKILSDRWKNKPVKNKVEPQMHIVNSNEQYQHLHKLNIGCGDMILDGYINADLYNPAAQVRCDALSLPFPNERFEEVFACHILEHITCYDVEKTLKEWKRVLKPGGKLVMEMPNILELCKHFEKSNKQERYRLLDCIYGTTMPAYPHKYGWYPEILFDILSACGFENIQFSEPKVPHWGHNMRVESQVANEMISTIKLADFVPIEKGDVYDCFIFCNELDILDIRLNELQHVVDKFVIVESVKTHTNKYKPLYFRDNKERYKKFQDKIIHIIVDDVPEGPDQWVRERHQRDCIMRGLKNCKDSDIIMMSDADEIPNAKTVRSYSPSMGLCKFNQNLYYYSLNTLCVNNKNWDWGKILPWSMCKNMTPCQVRYTDCPALDNGGWHFSYLGNVEFIQKKIDSWAHQEFNKPEINNIQNISHAIKENKDVFGRDLKFETVYIDDTYPDYVRDNLEMFLNKGFIRDDVKEVVETKPQEIRRSIPTMNDIVNAQVPPLGDGLNVYTVNIGDD